MSVEDAFSVFDQQDSGCLSYGVERSGRRWFVKTATEPHAAGPMTRVVALHRAVRHAAVVRPVAVLPGPTLIFPWCPGRVLNAATVHGGDRWPLDGRALQQLLTDDRSTDRERAVTARATDPDPGRRHPTVAALVADWRS